MRGLEGVAKLPRVATIQDYSCFGRCSLAVALPVISAAGVEVCAIPSALLSAHTGYGSPYVRELTNDMGMIIDHWISLGLRFDTIYIGYLANERQARQAERFINAFDDENTLIAVDPVMGDSGRLYGGLEGSLVEGMRALCARADVVLPNLTEAALLTGQEYHPAPSEAETARRLRSLLALGAKSAALTGVSAREGHIGAALLESNAGEPIFVETQRVEGAYHGSGDLFSSAVVACLARGASLTRAARCAADFTAKCLALTREAGSDEREGVLFEPLLCELKSATDAALQAE